MSKGLEALKELRENVCYFAIGDYAYPRLDIIEKELEDYQEIKEIAKRYNWDDFTSEIFNVEADKKYRDLFNGAIVYIQEDYRKARAFDIIKLKRVDVSLITDTQSLQEYNEKVPQYVICDKNGVDRLLTQEEYDLLRGVLL